MKTNKELLCSILQTAQMGQAGIRSVRKLAVQVELKKALDAQLREYDAIEAEAHSIAGQRGWRLPELAPGRQAAADMMSRIRLSGGDTDSKIAGMMIQGNTRGIITGLQNTHRHGNKDLRVSGLADKLLATEDANIRQMKLFL